MPSLTAHKNFTDDYTPGGSSTVPAAATDSRYMYIGGGKSSILNGTGPGLNGYPVGWYHSEPVPYTAGYGIGAAGQGQVRDVGAGPAFTNVVMKTVTAPGAVAAAAVVETNFNNRSGVALTTGQSVIGVGTVATAVPA